MDSTFRSRVTAGLRLGPVGYRKDGRPIFPIVGADPTDPSNDTVDTPSLNHSQAVNRLREITDEMSRLAELNELTAEDDAYFAELRTEFKDVDLHRKKLERRAQLAEIRTAAQGVGSFRLEAGARKHSDALDPSKMDADVFGDPASVEDFRGKDGRNPWALDEMRVFGRKPEEIRSELHARALSALERVRGTSDDIRSTGTDILEQHDDGEGTIAKLVLATTSPAYQRAFAKEARFEGNMLTDSERAAVQHARSLMRAMSLTGSGGGSRCSSRSP